MNTVPITLPADDESRRFSAFHLPPREGRAASMVVIEEMGLASVMVADSKVPESAAHPTSTMTWDALLREMGFNRVSEWTRRWAMHHCRVEPRKDQGISTSA